MKLLPRDPNVGDFGRRMWKITMKDTMRVKKFEMKAKTEPATRTIITVLIPIEGSLERRNIECRPAGM